MYRNRLIDNLPMRSGCLRWVSGACCSWQCVIDQELEGIVSVLVVGVLDLLDDFGQQLAAVDGFGIEPLAFSIFDFLDVFCV